MSHSPDIPEPSNREDLPPREYARAVTEYAIDVLDFAGDKLTDDEQMSGVEEVIRELEGAEDALTAVEDDRDQIGVEQADTLKVVADSLRNAAERDEELYNKVERLSELLEEGEYNGSANLKVDSTVYPFGIIDIDIGDLNPFRSEDFSSDTDPGNPDPSGGSDGSDGWGRREVLEGIAGAAVLGTGAVAVDEAFYDFVVQDDSSVEDILLEYQVDGGELAEFASRFSGSIEGNSGVAFEKGAVSKLLDGSGEIYAIEDGEVAYSKELGRQAYSEARRIAKEQK